MVGKHKYEKIKIEFFLSLLAGAIAWTNSKFVLKESGGNWLRMRLPVVAISAWVGSIIGAKQARSLSRTLTNSIEDPNLREVYDILHL